MLRNRFWIVLTLFFLPITSLLGEELTITTWNIEHLGTSGRGFGGGFGAGVLGMRTDAQLRQIGELIRDSLDSDVLALQEIAITSTDPQEGSRSDQLDTIVDTLASSPCLPLFDPPEPGNPHSYWVGGVILKNT